VCNSHRRGIGFAAHRTLLASLWAIPNIASQQFLVGPMSAIAAGLVLIDDRRVAPLTVPLCGFVLGAAAAIGIVITDPSLAGWTVRLAGCAAAIWTLTWAAISAAGLRGGWPRTAGAVLGSRLTGSSR
jgi:hypothetical protein